MPRSLKKLHRNLLSFCLIAALVCSSLLPAFAKPSNAFFGGLVFDPTHNASTIFQTSLTIADMAARAAAGAILQRMIDSTVEWANSGFDGNPAYAINPEQYFTDLADGIAGEFIAGSDLGYLCSPFQTQIRLALQKSYTQQQNQFQCTLTDVVANIEGFYGDFNQGGWDAWFSMTQNSANNPYGAYLAAQVELDSRIANSVGLERENLNRNQGFISLKKCPTGSNELDNGLGGTVCVTSTGNTVNKEIVTPGIAIKEQLDRVLPSTMDRFINAQHLEDLLEAFVTGALKKYVFGPEGLFSRGNSSSLPPPPSSTTPSLPQEPDVCDLLRQYGIEDLPPECTGGTSPEPINTPPKEPGGGEIQQ